MKTKRHNRLHITWGGLGLSLTPQGLKESFRVKTLERAKEVLARRNKENIVAAHYNDANGEVFTLI